MKKRILFINGHLNTGGVEKSLVDILRSLDYEQYEVDLLLLEELGDYIDQVPEQAHIQLRRLENTYGSVCGSIARCVRQRDWFCLRMRLIFLAMKLFGQKKIAMAKKLLTDGKHYDCVIGFRSGICTQITAFATNAKRRITWWHHGEINVDRREYIEVAGTCDRIAVVSTACRDMLAEAFPELAEKFTVIPNMLDAASIAAKAMEFNPYQDMSIPRLVTVGRLSPEKHMENVVFAAKELKNKDISFHWYIVGDGPYRQQLEKLISEQGVEDCVILAGNQPNPYPYMKNADLYVHSSYVESQGLVVLEAMALGVPCVVTKSLGSCEFIQDGVNGILTEQSPESLAEKVLEMLTNQILYDQIKSKTRCPEQFAPVAVMEKVEKLLWDI